LARSGYFDPGAITPGVVTFREFASSDLGPNQDALAAQFDRLLPFGRNSRLEQPVECQ
jgi:hypothetical protein